MWQHVKLSRSVPEIHSHVAGTLSNQPTKTSLKLASLDPHRQGSLIVDFEVITARESTVPASRVQEEVRTAINSSLHDEDLGNLGRTELQQVADTLRGQSRNNLCRVGGGGGGGGRRGGVEGGEGKGGGATRDVCVCVYKYVYVRMCVCVRACMYVCMCVNVCMNVCVWSRACVRACVLVYDST